MKKIFAMFVCFFFLITACNDISENQEVATDDINESFGDSDLLDSENILLSTAYVNYLGRVYSIDPALTPDPVVVYLENLDGSGKLSGKYAKVVEVATLNRYNHVTSGMSWAANPKVKAFLFSPVRYDLKVENNYHYFYPDYSGQRFDEVMLYYGVNLAAQWFDKTYALRTGYPIVVEAFNPKVSKNTVEAKVSTAGTDARIAFPLEQDGNINPYRGVKGIFHEVTHVLFNKTIIRKRVGNQAVNLLDLTVITVSEAYATYFPCSYYGKSEYYYSTPNHSYDIGLNYQYDPLHLQKIVDGKLQTNPDNFLAFAGALWDIRESFGSDVANRLVIDSWNLLPVNINRNFVEDALAALVLADRRMYSGVHVPTIILKFASHNITCPGL